VNRPVRCALGQGLLINSKRVLLVNGRQCQDADLTRTQQTQFGGRTLRHTPIETIELTVLNTVSPQQLPQHPDN
jgi:hypothetical protein